MNSKFYACVCCGCRITKADRRPVMAKSMQLFVATRMFPSRLANDSYICNKCRMMYIKWKMLPEFGEVLMMIDDSHEITNDTMEVNGDSSDEDYMNAEDSGNHSVNVMSSDTESMDNDDPDDAQTLNESSSDSESVYDATSDDQMKDEQLSSDENSEGVSYFLYLCDVCIILLEY